MMRRIYCDHNGTTPLRCEVKQVISDALDDWANPSSQSMQGKGNVSLKRFSSREAREGAY